MSPAAKLTSRTIAILPRFGQLCGTDASQTAGPHVYGLFDQAEAVLLADGEAVDVPVVVDLRNLQHPLLAALVTCGRGQT